jgi:hypothetical protein
MKKWINLYPFVEDPYCQTIPEDDIRLHSTTGTRCDCGPVVRDQQVIHNAFDGRDFHDNAIERKPDAKENAK